MKIPSLILLAITVVTASGAYADSWSCTGFTAVGGTVYGTCTDGNFNGYEATGGTVYGTCTDNQFSGYDQVGAMVSGTCSHEADHDSTDGS